MPIPLSSASAVVLAAGHSTRMGRDKALLELDGLPLWRRQVELLAGAGVPEIFLSVRPEQGWARAVHRPGQAAPGVGVACPGFGGLLYDALPGAGPLAGLAAALERASHPHVIAIAVDLPRVPAAWLHELAGLCAPGVGAVGRSGAFFEPLAAIYPRELRPAAWEALAAGHYALQPLLAAGVRRGQLRERALSTTELPWFENWNRPGDAAP